MILTLLEVVLRAVICVAAIIALTKLNGLRSFSKMSSFDFAITVALGSVIASSVISPDENLILGIMALVALFAVQRAIAWARMNWPGIGDAVDNAPLLIMENGEILHDNLARARITQADLFAKLREANAFDLSWVRAVVVEATGDVSVLHGDPSQTKKLSREVLADVQR